MTKSFQATKPFDFRDDSPSLDVEEPVDVWFWAYFPRENTSGALSDDKTGSCELGRFSDILEFGTRSHRNGTGGDCSRHDSLRPCRWNNYWHY
jgi:hypothetical protein